MPETATESVPCVFAGTCERLVGATDETINDTEVIILEAAALSHSPDTPVPGLETHEGRVLERATRAAGILCSLESAMPMRCQTCPLRPLHARARRILGYDRLDTDF